MKNRKLFSALSFLLLTFYSVFGQICSGLKSSKNDYKFDSYLELFAPPKRAFGAVGFIGAKFFFQPKNIPKLIGYKMFNERHPLAFAISDESSDYFEKSRKLVKNTGSGYIWLENEWLLNTWSKSNFKFSTHPEIAFLIGHEIIHIIHRKDKLFQRKVTRMENGKFIFERKPDGEFIGFFEDVPDGLKDHAEELHSDYGGGLTLYDLVLAPHDDWALKSQYESIRKAHRDAYDLIIQNVEKFIREELAPEETKSHGTADERVKYFLQGVQDRKAFINSLGTPKLKNNYLKGADPKLISMLQDCAKKLRVEYSKTY